MLTENFIQSSARGRVLFLRQRVEQTESTTVLLKPTPLMWLFVEILPESSIGSSYILLTQTAAKNFLKNKAGGLVPFQMDICRMLGKHR